MELPSIAVKIALVTVSGTLADGSAASAADLADVDFALLPPNKKPRDGQVWLPPITYVNRVAKLKIAGFEAPADAEAMVAPITDADLWMLVNDGDEVDAVLIERINVTT